MGWYRDVYLNSEDWKNLRAAVLSITPKCEICGTTNGLDVHHLRYRKIWDVIPQADLSVLCRECHQGVHAGTKNMPDNRRTQAREIINRITQSKDPAHPNAIRGIRALTKELSVA